MANVYASVESAWLLYLRKSSAFDVPPVIGAEWPKAGARVLPDADTFMDEVYRCSRPKVMRILNLSLTKSRLVASTGAER